MKLDRGSPCSELTGDSWVDNTTSSFEEYADGAVISNGNVSHSHLVISYDTTKRGVIFLGEAGKYRG